MLIGPLWPPGRGGRSDWLALTAYALNPRRRATHSIEARPANSGVAEAGSGTGDGTKRLSAMNDVGEFAVNPAVRSNTGPPVMTPKVSRKSDVANEPFRFRPRRLQD